MANNNEERRGLLFRSKHNIQYLKKMNKQLVERVVGEKITYFAISNQFTKKNLYNEAKEKIFSPPVEVYALVRWKSQEVSTNKFGQDIIYNIQFLPLIDTLNELNLDPREGDVVEYDSKRFEITTIEKPLQMLGKEEESFYLQLDCVSIRDHTFYTEISGSPADAENTRPDVQMSSSFRYSDVLFPFSSSV